MSKAAAVYGRSFLSCPALSKGFESGLSDRWTYVLLMSVSHGAAPLIFCNGTSVHSGCTSPSPERSVSRALDKMEPAIANRSHGSDVNNINSTVYSVYVSTMCSERATLSMILSEFSSSVEQ